MPKVRKFLRVGLFVLAGVVLWIALGVGLQVSTSGGTALLAVAAALAIAGVLLGAWQDSA